jgi:hypothetical protein
LGPLGRVFWELFATTSAVTAAGALYFSSASLGRRLVAAVVLALGLSSGLFIAFWMVFFRDGMAPGFIPSTGMIAVRRSLPALLGVVPVVACTFVALRILHPHSRKPRERAA